MLRNSFTGIPDLDHQYLAAATATHQDAAATGVAQGIADQIEQNAFDDLFVAAHPEPRRPQLQPQSLLCRRQRKILTQAIQHLGQGEAADARHHIAAVEARNVEDRIEQVLQGVHCRLDVRNQFGLLSCRLGLRQGRDEKAQCVQGLAQVVTGGGQKVRFGDGGVLRRILRLLQVGSSLGDPGTQVVLRHTDAFGHAVDAARQRAQGACGPGRHARRQVAGTDTPDDLVGLQQGTCHAARYA